MKPATGKSKRVEVYLIKESGAITVAPTVIKNGRIIQKTPVENYGSILKKGASAQEIGQAVLHALDECTY